MRGARVLGGGGYKEKNQNPTKNNLINLFFIVDQNLFF